MTVVQRPMKDIDFAKGERGKYFRLRVLGEAAKAICGYCRGSDGHEIIPIVGHDAFWHLFTYGNGRNECSAGPIWALMLRPANYKEVGLLDWKGSMTSGRNSDMCSGSHTRMEQLRGKAKCPECGKEVVLRTSVNGFGKEDAVITLGGTIPRHNRKRRGEN